MTAAIVIFNYKNTKTSVSCTTSETMQTICERYISKIQKDINKLNFIYNGSLINKNLQFAQQINDDLDKFYYSMNITVEEKTKKNIRRNNMSRMPRKYIN